MRPLDNQPVFAGNQEQYNRSTSPSGVEKPNNIDNDELESRKQDKLQLRLDAEASIGVSAALIGGFALSLIPEARNMNSHHDENLQPRNVFITSMALSGCLALFALLVSGSIYWAGKHLLSASCNTIKEENLLFRKWWKLDQSKRARWISRKAFEMSMPVFLIGIGVLVWDITEGAPSEWDQAMGAAGEEISKNTSSIWVMILVGGFFFGLLVFAIPLTRGVEKYVLRETATA